MLGWMKGVGSVTTSRLRRLIAVERAITTALSHLSAAAVGPEARGCIDASRYAAAWVCAGLERLVPPRAKRLPPGGAAGVRRLVARVQAGPTPVDRLRLVNRSQREAVRQIDGLLAETLEPELRAFLEGARAVLARSVGGCDEIIAMLDRGRELQRGSG
jgi:hypothetical protein